MNSLSTYVGILCLSIVCAVAALFCANWASETWLQRHPRVLMSEADRINENTRALREKMIPPDKVLLWYDFRSADELKPMWDEFYSASAVFESYVHFRPRPLLGN